MLGKQLWRLLMNQNSLVAKVVQTKYHRNCELLEAHIGGNPSFVWRSLCAARDLVKRGLRWKIRDGNSVNVIREAWLADKVDPWIMTTPMPRLCSMKVSELLNPVTREWNEDLIRDLFNERDSGKILKLKIGRGRGMDDRFWCFDRRGFYTVKTAYHMQVLRDGGGVLDDEVVWKRFWNLKIPPKIKHFAWSMVNNCIPVIARLQQKGILPNSQMCPVCNRESETVVHAMFHCQFARSCWSSAYMDDICYEECGSTSVEKMKYILCIWTIKRCSEVVCLMWNLWKQRNNWVWNGCSCSIFRVVDGAARTLEEWQSCNVNNTPIINGSTRMSADNSKWSKPRAGWLKANTDVAMDGGTRSARCASVIRNSDGMLVGFITKLIMDIDDPCLAELLCIREALSRLKSHYQDCLIVESDSLTAVNNLNGRVADRTYIGDII